jgi:hypothetical protein
MVFMNYLLLVSFLVMLATTGLRGVGRLCTVVYAYNFSTSEAEAKELKV